MDIRTIERGTALVRRSERPNWDLTRLNLLKHFEFNGRIWTSKHYPAEAQPLDPNHRRFFYPGQQLSPLIIGTPKDLAYYPVSGAQHPEFREAGPQTFLYLKKYLLIPTKGRRLVLLSDTHNHAYFGWHLAKEQRLIGKPTVLIHIDGHKDNYFPVKHHTRWPRGVPRMKSSRHWTLNDRARIAQEWLDIHDYLAFDDRFFREVAYVLPEFSKKNINVYSHGLEMRTMEGQFLSIENVGKFIQDLKTAGYDVIVNLDLDYFAGYFPGAYLTDPRICEKPLLLPFDENLRLVIEAVKQAEFITVATSPDWFLPQETVVRDLAERIIAEL